jgi:D-glycerate 3-kinase
MAMPGPEPAIVEALFRTALDRSGDGFAILGLCGAQGSGKSTLAQAVLDLCKERKVAAAVLSLDDLYLTRAERRRLAREVHPLLATRGVPGTHDIALGLEVMAALAEGRSALLPRFSKAADDRLPRSQWRYAPADCRLLIFEGWCVGARPQAREALRAPINELEAREDAGGVWRGFVNDALAGPYQRLFVPIDRLALLAAPGFDVVFEWRLQQEDALRTASGADAAGVMDAAEVARFIQHYERLTRHILTEMPPRADLVIYLAEDRSAIHPPD